MTMKWTRISEYAIRSDPWTISKALVKGVPVYQLWHDKQPVSAGSLGSFNTADAAKKEAERIELGRQA